MNPIAPYRWEARYALGRLCQLDVDGWHTSREIDRQRLRTLVVLGHPDSPISLPVPYPTAPDEILIRGTTDLHATMESGTGARSLRTARWVFVGVRYGADAWVIQLDPHGHVVALQLELPAGAALDPVPCVRCGPQRGDRAGILSQQGGST